MRRFFKQLNVAVLAILVAICLWVSPVAAQTFGFTTLADPLEGTGSYPYQGTFAEGISGGNVVGYYNDSSSINHSFLYSGSTYTTLNVPATISSAYGISGSNIVGYYNNISGNHGFLYNGSTFTTLDDPSGIGNTVAYGISGGNIVGYYNNHGFLYNVSTYTTLNVPWTAYGTYAYGICGCNVVGVYNDGSGQGQR